MAAISRKTFQHQVLDCLGLDICAGKYAPGDILPSEAELCEHFSFSRIVIREAIKSLAAKGMLKAQRKVGTLVLEYSEWNSFDPDIIAWRRQVPGLDQKMTRDFMELRRIVEPAAAHLAALRAGESELRAIRGALGDMERAVDGQGDYPLADLAFHTAILSSCDNQFLQQICKAMSEVLHGNFKILEKRSGGPFFSLPLHQQLCRAIETGNAKKARQVALRVIEQADEDLKILNGE